MAIMTRWRWPPENWCGKLLHPLLRIGDLDQAAASRSRGRAPRCGSRRDAAARFPRSDRRSVMTGLSDVIGSWKIIEISLPRMRRISSSRRAARFIPLKSLSLRRRCGPFPWEAAGRIDSAVTLLPQPDSPTSPTVRPSAMSKVTPSTARTSPSLVKNEVRRSLILRSGAIVGFAGVRHQSHMLRHSQPLRCAHHR